MAAAILLPSVGAAPIQAAGEFNFQGATFDGTIQLDAQLHAFQWNGGPSTRTPVVNLDARELVVNVTTIDEYKTGFKPTRPSENQGTVSKGPPRYQEWTYSGATGRLTQMEPNSNWLFDANRTVATVRSFGPVAATLHPSVASSWWLTQTDNYAQAGTISGTRKVDVPARLPEWGTSSPQVAINGTFLATYWNATMEFQWPGGSASYRSGTWTTNETPTAPGIHPAVREVRTQIVELRLRHATLALDADAGFSRLVGPRVSMAGNANVTISEAVGSLRMPQRTVPLSNASLSFQGGFSLESAPFKDLTRLAGDLQLADAVVDLIEIPTVQAPNGSEHSRPPTVRLEAGNGHRTPWTFGLGLLALLPLGIFLVVRHERNLDLDDAELALLRERPRRAVRITRRLLRKTPKDPHVLFVHGAGLFQAGEVAAVLAEVEQPATQVPPKQRAGLALLLCLANAKQRNDEAAERWAAEAAKDPGTRRELEGGALDLKGRVPSLAGYA